MNDYSTISALSAAMMNSLPASCLPHSASIFNNPALNTPSSIAAAVANLNNNFANANQSSIQSIQTQNSPSSTPLNHANQTSSLSNTTPPTSANLNSFALNGLDQAVNYHLQHPSPYIQW